MAGDRTPRILVVDDEPSIRALLMRILKAEGYESVALNDGLAGLDAALTAADPYDLVITNNRMPHLDGAELVAHLRAAHPDLPILHLDDLSRPGAAELPPDVPNLYKPFNVEVLLDHVERLLQGVR
jgi:DNA-binding response OmpR family regulator